MPRPRARSPLMLRLCPLTVALSLAAAAPRRVEHLANVIGGADVSRRQQQPWLARNRQLPCMRGFVAKGPQHDGGHDRAFTAALWPAFADADAVEFLGHGMPGEVVG